MRVATIFLAVAAIAHAQGVITTFAGTDWVFPGDGKPAVNAPLGSITGLTIDAAGNPVFVDLQNCMVDRLNPDGTLTVLAGIGCIVFASGRGSTGDGGPATRASLWAPQDVAYDRLGNLYVTGLHDVRKISPSGTITTIAPLSQGQLFGVAADAEGNVYFSELTNNRVRKVTPAGAVVTVAGQDSGAAGSGGDNGPAILASLSRPDALAVDSRGNLYIGDAGNFRVRMVTPGGTISTVVSGIAPHGMAFDGTGNLFVGGNYAVYKFPPGSLPLAASANLPAPIAGSPNATGFSGDGGVATGASFGGPLDVAPDNRGNVYISDWGNSRVRRIAANGTLATVAGNGQFRIGPDGVPAVDAPLNTPVDLVLDPAGNLYFTQGNMVSRVDTKGILTTIAGSSQRGRTGDGGPAVAALLALPSGLALDAAGNLYVADRLNNAVRKIDRAGLISTLARVDDPEDVAVDLGGKLYVSSQSGARVLSIDSAGRTSVYAGSGTSGYSGDGGPAVNAALNLPRGLVVDSKGNLYISDSGNHRVRMVTPQGIISTIAGNGTAARRGDGGPASQASLNLPGALAMDGPGNLYVSEVNSIVVRRISPTGIISTFAGGGPYDQSSDGKLASTARFYSPYGIAVDATGNVFIADAGSGVFGDRIRKVLAEQPTVKVIPPILSLTAASGGVPATRDIVVIGSLSGIQFQVRVDGTSGPANWLTVDSSADVTPRILTVKADPTNLAPGTYTAVLTISAVTAVPPALTVNVSFAVGPPASPALAVDKPSLSFTLPKGSAARASTLQVSNSGGQTVAYTATIRLNGGGNWLTVSPITGSAKPGQPSTLTVTADPSGLAPGTYSGQITIQGGNAGTATVPVIVTVSSNPQAILLTQTGLSFTAVAQGGVIPPQSFGVINAGSGGMSWQASSSTTGGGNWLAVSPAAGSSDGAGVAPQVTVTVHPAGLAAGQYYGTVRVDAPGTANRTRLLTVFLNVLPAGTSTNAAVQPSELVFYASPGGGPPGSQVVEMYNISAAPRRFTSARSSGSTLLFVLPDSGTLDPRQPSQVIVQPDANSGDGSFAAGTYNGTLTFQFSDGTVQRVKTTVISAASAMLPRSAELLATPRPLDAGSCIPTKVTVAVKSLGYGFQVSAGWPVGLSVEVSDECQRWVAGSGNVVASFDDGGDDVPLTPLNDGTWQGTWKPRRTNPRVNVTIHARSDKLPDPAVVISGELAAAQDRPTFTGQSIAAVFAPPTPVDTSLVAPGSYLSIDGSRLADYKQDAVGALVTQLANAEVQLDDLPPAFLTTADSGRIQFIVPGAVSLYTSVQVRVKRGDALSLPVELNTAAAQPSILQAAGNAFAFASSVPDRWFLVTDSTRTGEGDTLILFCSGLGATTPAVADGQPGPSPWAKVAGVTAAIGGRNADVQSAVLVPGYVGLYQVDLLVPGGVPVGGAPLTVSIGGQTSPAVNLFVR